MDTLTETQAQDLRDVFDVLDVNKNGSIDIQELGKGLRGLGLNPTQAQINSLMETFDSDNNKSLSVEEFANLYVECTKKELPTEEDLIEQFKKLDVNKDGKISASELKRVLLHGDEALGEDEAQEIIDDFDKNGDGYLDLQEFLNGVMGKDS
jgi:Ca2+-binding EF-hand superfamily protein